MTRGVLLRHDLPDGSHHFDWMVELAIPDEHRLVTLRIPPPPAPADPPGPMDPAGRPFTAELLPPHRAAYLDHEGPIAGDRGTVTRLAAGPAGVLERTETRLRIRCDLGVGPHTYLCERPLPAGEFTCRLDPAAHPQTPNSGTPRDFRVR